MKFDGFTISRIIFLGFIIVISVYFIIENKKPKHQIERYEDAASSAPSTSAPAPSTQSPTANIQKVEPNYIGTSDADIEKSIYDIYNELYKAPPSQEELSFYKDYAKSRPSLEKDKFREVIETSAPTLQKTFYTQKYADTPDEVFGMENEIIEVFNELLMRNPDRQELYSFAKLMKDDTKFSLDKLRQVLIASEEFKRMEKTQNNRVYVNLQSNITDRQLTLQVTKIYSQVTGKDYLDEDTLKFLKRKFVEFDLNEGWLAKFIESYVMNKPFERPAPPADTSGAAGAGAEGAAKETQDSASLDEIKKSILAELEAAKKEVQEKGTSDEGAVNAEAFNNQDGKNIFNGAKLYFFGSEAANSEVLSSILKNGAVGADGSVDTTKMINNIKDNSSCVFNKNAAEVEMLEKNKQELADYINSRNMNHLQNVCQRNKKYINADDNMVLFPEFKWSVPQKYPPVCVGGCKNNVSPVNDQTALIGTLLPEAKNTEVGSILPVFPPV